jgi:proteasome lid subunit RPN8/RPN11
MAGNVSISHQALEQVFTDSVEAGGIEVGGLLVGYPSNRGIHIKRAIPTSRGTITRIPITSEDMARAAEKLDRGEQIVGWYHSHPGHTVFFSQNDIESHERFLEFNPQFQALVIDPVQAEQGDYIVDCVKFYAVRNHRATEIDNYYITNYSGERLYNPVDFVFDRHGFPHRSQAYVGVTSADDRELRQRLGAALAERDELQDNYVILRKQWKSTYHFSRRIFPFALIFSILAIGLLGFTLGVIVSQASDGRTPEAGEELPETGEELPETGEELPEASIILQSAVYDAETGKLIVKMDLNGFEKKTYQIWIHFLDDKNNEIETLKRNKYGAYNSNPLEIEFNFMGNNNKSLKDCKNISVEISTLDGNPIWSKKFPLTCIFLKIKEDPIQISDSSLEFQVYVYGPLDVSCHSFRIYLSDSKSIEAQSILLAELLKNNLDPSSTYNIDPNPDYLEESKEIDCIGNIITVTLYIKNDMISEIQGKFLYVVVEFKEHDFYSNVVSIQ